jgi:cephalosporin hydroxylase
METSKSYSNEIPNEFEFKEAREQNRQEMANCAELRERAIQLTVASNEFQYGYQWEWCGVPIIRHPDDIVLQQEIMWDLKPTRVIETGIARGGSLVLTASLLTLQGLSGKVLGLDIQILPHAHTSLLPWTSSGQIEVIECDSTSEVAVNKVEKFLCGVSTPCLLIVDSNHSHDHVLNELNLLAPLLPLGSIVIVADTIVEEMPPDYYPDRPWGRGNNPLTAVRKFLNDNSDFKLDSRWSRRSLMGECRDGILIRVKNSSKETS